MKTKLSGGLLLAALVGIGLSASASEYALPNASPSDAQASTLAQSANSVIYGTVYDSVYPGVVDTGRTVNFWINDSWNSSYSVDVYVSSAKDEDEPLEDTSCYTIFSRTNYSAEITFNLPGIYYVNFRVYDSTDQLVATYKSYQVIVKN